MEVLFAFLGGLLIGSFLNVCIYRLPRDLSVWSPSRSFCPGCETTIAWYDNVPLLSWALLRGRSRCCEQSIPLRYPFVELVTGIAFAACVWAFGMTLETLKWVLFSAIMIDLIVTDWEERILPDEFTLGGTLVGLVLAWYVPLESGIAAFAFTMTGMPYNPHWLSLAEAATGATLMSGTIYGVAWLFQRIRHKEGMGFGDFKMMMLIGVFLGLQGALYTLVLASVFGSLTGPAYALIAERKLWARLSRTMGRRVAAGAIIFRFPLPFGSFLGIASLVVAFWGPVLLSNGQIP
jgi:leader peptidase (prepilin peptidase)/N-methyltransferase